MAIGFLLIAPSAVGVGYRPPELVRTAVGVPDEQEQQDLVELAGEIQQIPGVLGFFDHSSPTDAGVLIEDDDSTAETVAALVVLAVANRLCLVGYDIAGGTVGDVLVNATGGPTDCRMRTSQDAVTLHVSRQSITDALGADIAANEGPDGRPFIVIEPVDPALSPVPGVVFVQAARTPGGRWIIEHRSGDRIMALEYPVVSVEYLIDVLSLFINGDGEEFLDLEWEETDVTVDALDGTAPTTAPTQPQPVTFLFFRAEDFDDAPGEFRTARDFAAAAGEFADIASGAPRDAEAPATPATPATPQVLDDLAAWMNRRALQAAEDPENPPSHLYMDLDPYPVRPRGAILMVTVPLAAEIHDDTFADLILHAATTGVCMLEENGRVWVNASGLAPGAPPTLCRFSVRGGGLVASATPESLRATLESAVIAGTEGFVLSVEPTGRGVPAPVDGVREVQVGIGDHRWIVHRLAEGERLSLVDPGSTVEDIVDLLTGFMAGDATVLLDREWEDISEGTVPDETTRWQLSDSVGNVFNVGEVEVHVAVPMNYAPDLDWFQVADQVVLGDYITADRHLGTRWSVMWGHGYGEEQYYRRIVDSREDAESLIHAWIDESEQDFLARGWDLVDND